MARKKKIEVEQLSLFENPQGPTATQFRDELVREFRAQKGAYLQEAKKKKRRNRGDSIFLPEDQRAYQDSFLVQPVYPYPEWCFPPTSTKSEDVTAILRGALEMAALGAKPRIGLDFEFSPEKHRISIIGVADLAQAAACKWSDDFLPLLYKCIDEGVAFVGHWVLGADKFELENAAREAGLPEILKRPTGCVTSRDAWLDSMGLHYLCNQALCKSPGKEADTEGSLGYMGIGSALFLSSYIPPGYKSCRGVGCTGPCPRERVFDYCAVDAFSGLVIAENYLKVMHQKSIPFSCYEKWAELTMDVCLRAETRGLLVNKPFLDNFDTEMEKKKEGLFPYENSAYKYFNPQSGKQIIDFFHERGIPLRDARGKGSSTKGVILSALETELEKYGFRELSEFEHSDDQVVLSEVDELLYKLFLYKDTGKSSEAWFNQEKKFLVQHDGEWWIHPRFSTTGASTTRLCIAAGTPIDVLRDVTVYPKGIPIEHVKVGDLAYTYNDKKELCLRRVVWAGKTGHKKVVRVHWQSRGNNAHGYTDMTPEHMVRLVSGDYREAKDLKKNDRVLALKRGITGYGYQRMWATGYPEIAREHRFVAEQLGWNIEGMHVHHKNDNKMDNRSENLEVLSGSEHTSFHARKMQDTPGHREKLSKELKRLHRENPEIWANSHKRGEDHPEWLGLSKEFLEETFMKYGKMIAFRDECGYDYETIQKYFKRHGLDWRILKKRYKEQNNHIITKVEYLEDSVDVYDLEIEETHCFIANEICVHNSSSRPNFQNFKKRGLGSEIRRAIIPRPGCIMCANDAKQLEFRIVAYEAGIEVPGYDFFTWLVERANGQFEKAAELMHGKARDIAKRVNHASAYGEGFKLFDGWQLATKRTHQQVVDGSLRIFEDWEMDGKVVGFTGANLAQTLFGDKTDISRRKALNLQFDVWLKAVPEIHPWHRKITKIAESGWAQLRTGHYLELLGSPSDNFKAGCAYFGQGGGAQFMQDKMIQSARKYPDFPMCAQIHDDLMWDNLPASWTLEEIKGFVAHLSNEETVSFPGLLVPFETQIGPNWGQMKEI